MSKKSKKEKMPFRFQGMIPAVMLPVNGKGQPYWVKYLEVAKSLIKRGASAVVANGSMGDWSLISIDDRIKAVELLRQEGIPVVVGTGAQNPQTSRKIAEHAKKVDAAGLMMIPRLITRASVEAAQFTHFSNLLSVGLPAVIYNSPHYSYQTRAPLFFKLREKHKNLIGFKEFGGADALSYAAEHITSAEEDLSLVVGVDTQVVHGYLNCNAVGAITGIGNALAEEVITLIKLCEKGRQGNARSVKLAQDLGERLNVLSKFDEGVDLVQYYKLMMVLSGHKEYAQSTEPSDSLSVSQINFATAQYHQFKAWWKDFKQVLLKSDLA